MIPHRKTCLVVDDSKLMRLVARKILADLDFRTVEASSGREALDLCHAHLPDAVLIDWRMPEMNGLQFLKEFRELPGGEDPLVVFCTTEDDGTHIRQAFSAGADKCVVKPFDRPMIEAEFCQMGLL